LLAQSRAVGSGGGGRQSTMGSSSDTDKPRQSVSESNQQNSDAQSNTDSESYNDTSGLSESEGENESNIDDLRKPVDNGWNRETVIKGLTRSGHLKGEVFYYSPYSPAIKLKTIHQIQQELKKHESPFKNDHFSFSARKIVGSYLQAAPAPYATDGEYVKMTDVEVSQRLEEIRLYTKQSVTPLNVEQRIEIARQQQALRDAKKIAKEELYKAKEKASV